MTFLVDGVHLTHDPYDICTETRCRITLDNLNVHSSGTYRCEVSGDAPAFRLSYEASNMTIIGKLSSLVTVDLFNDYHDGSIVLTTLQYFTFVESLVIIVVSSSLSSPMLSFGFIVQNDGNHNCRHHFYQLHAMPHYFCTNLVQMMKHLILNTIIY